MNGTCQPHPQSARHDQVMAAENELVLSVLSAASSLQKLNERLDSISLHSEQSSPQPSPRVKPFLQGGDNVVQPGQWQFGSTEALLLEKRSLSGLEDSASESPTLRLSHTSSKFDSAFGSQTDEELPSLHTTVQSLHAQAYQHYSDRSPRLISRAFTHETKSSNRSPRPKGMQLQPGHSQKRIKKKRRYYHNHDRVQDTSSPDTTPESHHSHNNVEHKGLSSSSYRSPNYHSMSGAYVHPEPSWPLKRMDSTRSISSTLSTSSTHSSSSRILSLELSMDDLRGMTSKPHSKPDLMGQSVAKKADLGRTLRQTSSEIHESGSDMDTTNSGASTPVVSKKFQLQTGELFCHSGHESASFGIQESLDTSNGLDSATDHAVPHSKAGHPLNPEIVVIDPRKEKVNKAKQQQKLRIDGGRSKHVTATKPKKKVTIVVDPKPTTSQQSSMGTHFYHESLTPQPSPRQQQRNEVDSPQQRANAPKRRASILQRLRRRRGSFKAEKRPKRHVPVKRAFSDRMTYDIRKGWIDYEEDLEFISNPSRLRRVGRMIARKAGTLHIVQLNRPPSGMYGIYISQTESRPGIFISRFADSNAAKFYTGLLSPGDEIIQVNKEDVKDKSVDYVYDMLEKVDSVIFSIVPVCSRPDW